jgi:hypothetical protein
MHCNPYSEITPHFEKMASFVKPIKKSELLGFLDFFHRQEFQILKNTTFLKLYLLPSSGESRETPTLLGSIERAPSRHPKTERDPVSETLCFLVFGIPDDGHIPEAQ